MQLKDWKDKGQFIHTGGHRIFYVEEGKGDTLLLLHAYPTASWGWHRIWPALRRHFRVIAPDLLGSGFSDKPKGRYYSIYHLTDIVEALLTTLNVTNIHILAHAYGVSVAQELIARHIVSFERGSGFLENAVNPLGWRKNTSRILSVCFINGGLFPEVSSLTIMQKLLLTSAGNIIASSFPAPYPLFYRNFKRTFGTHTQPRDTEVKEYWQLLTFNDGHKRVPDVIQYLNERKEEKNQERWVGALQQTEIPLCLLSDPSDKLSGEPVNQLWRKYLPGSDLITFDKQLGHYPPLEAPGDVLSHFYTFIRKTGKHI